MFNSLFCTDETFLHTTNVFFDLFVYDFVRSCLLHHLLNLCSAKYKVKWIQYHATFCSLKVHHVKCYWTGACTGQHLGDFHVACLLEVVHWLALNHWKENLMQLTLVIGIWCFHFWCYAFKKCAVHVRMLQ